MWTANPLFPQLDPIWLIFRRKAFLLCPCACALCSVLSNSLWPVDRIPPASSAHGIFQTRILEWVAISFFTGSFQPRERTHISCFGRILCHCTTWVCLFSSSWNKKLVQFETAGNSESHLMFRDPFLLCVLCKLMKNSSSSTGCIFVGKEMGPTRETLNLSLEILPPGWLWSLINCLCCGL